MACLIEEEQLFGLPGCRVCRAGLQFEFREELISCGDRRGEWDLLCRSYGVRTGNNILLRADRAIEPLARESNRAGEFLLTVTAEELEDFPVSGMQNLARLFGCTGGDRDPDKTRRTGDAVVGWSIQDFPAGGAEEVDGDGFPGRSVHEQGGLDYVVGIRGMRTGLQGWQLSSHHLSGRRSINRILTLLRAA